MSETTGKVGSVSRFGAKGVHIEWTAWKVDHVGDMVYVHITNEAETAIKSYAMKAHEWATLHGGRPLSTEAQALIGKLLAPGIDAADVFADDAVWAEARAAFPKTS
jgi:hypothetical protein